MCFPTLGMHPKHYYEFLCHLGCFKFNPVTGQFDLCMSIFLKHIEINSSSALVITCPLCKLTYCKFILVDSKQ